MLFAVVEPAKRAIDALAQGSIAPNGGSCKARGRGCPFDSPGLAPEATIMRPLPGLGRQLSNVATVSICLVFGDLVIGASVLQHPDRRPPRGSRSP